MSKSVLSIPDNVISLLASLDKSRGLPDGTMMSIMQQEVGGQVGKYLQDPSTYHYGLNAEGKRIAPHTGKVSTAFGPFGILESTAANPGYGVAPLKDRSLEEQARFAADYLKARGIAAYGEGSKYADQVIARRDGKAPVQMASAPVAQTPPVATQEAPSVQMAAAPPVNQGPLPVGYVAPSPEGWEATKQALLARQVQDQQPVTPADLEFMSKPMAMGNPAIQTAAVDFSPFKRLRGRV